MEDEGVGQGWAGFLEGQGVTGRLEDNCGSLTWHGSLTCLTSRQNALLQHIVSGHEEEGVSFRDAGQCSGLTFCFRPERSCKMVHK